MNNVSEAQEAAYDYIDNAVYDGATKIVWAKVVNAVVNSTAQSTDWNINSLREVLDTYLDDGSLQLVDRHSHANEEYNVDLYNMLRRS